VVEKRLTCKKTKVVRQALLVLAAVSGASAFGDETPVLPQTGVSVDKEESRPPAESFEFKGYWRAGFNTASPFAWSEAANGTSGNPVYNFFEKLTLEAPDAQGAPRLKTSRHAKDPNYLKLQMSKSFPSEVKVVFGIDTKEAPAHSTAIVAKSSSENASSALNASNTFRMRDLYAVFPTSSDMRLWAGSRQIEFEDLRLFESGNPFDTKALGVGLETDNSFFSMGYSKSKRVGVIEGISEEERAAKKIPPVLVDTKDASFVYRKEFPLEMNYTVMPMGKIIIHGAAHSDSTTGGKRQSMRGSQEFMFGTVMSRENPESGNIGNTTMGINLRPPELSEASLRGDIRGFDTIYFLQDSSIFNFNGWSALSAVAVEQTVFKKEQTVFKVADDGSVLASDAKTKSQRTVALGLQPVLYVTSAFHLALDMNYSFRDKKIDKTQSNALLVTPIIRYALSGNVLGSPQIYTSFTYGRYDLDFKKQLDGSFKNTLSTMQSGIELWF
jgi:hypothetical protein